MLKLIINEREFDNLKEVEQMHYLYCKKCNYFYLAINHRKHLCGKEE